MAYDIVAFALAAVLLAVVIAMLVTGLAELTDHTEPPPHGPRNALHH